MSYNVSKLLWLAVQPSNLIAIFMMIGIALIFFKFRKSGIAALCSGAAVYSAIVFLSAGQIIMAPLENRYPANPELPENISGILLLSGPLDRQLTVARGQISIRDGAERYFEFAKLVRRFADAKAVISGGNPSTTSNLPGEAVFARRILAKMGIDPEMILYETQSRNTAENVKFSHELVEPEPDENWIVVTSAYHMPRAISVMAKRGWNAIPYPVDFRTEGEKGRRFFTFDSGEAFAVTDLAAKEWIGLFYYYLTGKSASIWP